MAEEPDVKDAEITLDDFNADEQESPKAATSTAEDKKPEKSDKPDKAEAKETKASEAEDPATEESEAKETETDKPAEPEDETETKPQGEDKSLKPKSENRFQNLANENRELRRQVEQLTAQVYQPATEEELTGEVNPETGENYNRLEAKFEAYRQQQELEKYNSQVFGAQAEIGNEAYSIMSDFPTFNPDSEQFDGELATEAAQLLEANLVRDPNVPEIDPETGKQTGKGIVIGSNVSPYQLYKTLARASGISTTKGQLKGQQDTEKMLANADTASNVSPPKAKTDPLVELWKSDD